MLLEYFKSITFSKILCIFIIMLTASRGFADQKIKVVVVGAGLAGLTTAYRLQQKGMEVDVYEVRNRVGGRILTAKIENDVVELGGQNITDGGKAENILRLIEELQLELTVNRFTLDYHYFDGEKFIPGHLLSKKGFDPEELKLQLTQAVQKSHNMRDVLNEIIREDDLLYKTISLRLAAYEGAPPEKLSLLYVDTLYHMLLGGICSAHPNEGKKETFVDIVTIKGGNALLTEKLARALRKRVHLNMPLNAISKASDHSYELVFQNGQKVKADILVLAIPASVYDDIVFEENLISKERLESIRSIKYGTNAKILVPFTQSPSKAMTFIDDCIGSFFANRKILTLYCTGEASKFSQNTIFKTYEREWPMLKLGFGEFCPPFSAPTFARDEFLISYTGPIGYSWPNDPYVKGSYSYISPGQETLMTSLQNEDGERVRALFAPIDQTLYFVGEHASILMEVPGTMEAACESGERIARMIAKALQSETIY
jgi:monoamine oxidase